MVCLVELSKGGDSLAVKVEENPSTSPSDACFFFFFVYSIQKSKHKIDGYVLDYFLASCSYLLEIPLATLQ